METIDVQRADGIVTITLNRPEKKNAINGAMWDELLATFREIAASSSDRAVIITGAGGAFCSGADLTGGGLDNHQLANMRHVGDVCLALARLPQPVIAKVRGVAVGAGCNMALGADLVVASTNARFSEIFARRGLSVDFGGSWLLPRIVGMQKAKELALLADIIAHPGIDRSFVADHLEAILRNAIIYRFQANGSCVVETKSTALQAFHVGRAMFVMTAPLTTHGNSYSREYYIPKTRPFILEGRAFDFRGIQRFDEKPAAAIEFLAAGPCLEDPKNLPERFVQFLGREENGRTRRDVGFALGYSLVNGITRPEVRATQTHNAGMIHTSLKSYPIAIDSKMGLIPPGMEFHCVGYRDYFSPLRYPDATCVYWHSEGKDILLYADYHQKLEHTLVKLPPEFSGLKISIVEKTPSVTLHTKEVVPSTGIDLSIAQSYGYVVLRLHRP